jgi:hypothetical protein
MKAAPIVSLSRFIAIVDFAVIANADTRDKAASSDGDQEDEQDGNEKRLAAAV